MGLVPVPLLDGRHTKHKLGRWERKWKRENKWNRRERQQQVFDPTWQNGRENDVP